jgi:hypothetical protein
MELVERVMVVLVACDRTVIKFNFGAVAPASCVGICIINYAKNLVIALNFNSEHKLLVTSLQYFTLIRRLKNPRVYIYINYKKKIWRTPKIIKLQ